MGRNETEMTFSSAADFDSTGTEMTAIISSRERFSAHSLSEQAKSPPNVNLPSTAVSYEQSNVYLCCGRLST